MACFLISHFLSEQTTPTAARGEARLEERIREERDEGVHHVNSRAAFLHSTHLIDHRPLFVSILLWNGLNNSCHEHGHDRLGVPLLLAAGLPMLPLSFG
jgi:hypothetical protein